MTTADQVREILKTAELWRFNYDRCADALGISPSCFRNRLREEGTSFSELKDAERLRRLKSMPMEFGFKMAKPLGFRTANGFYFWHQKRFGYGWRDAKHW